METNFNNINDIKQIKLIPAGCQTSYKNIISSNDIYFSYASTMTINIFDIKNMQIKCIFNPNIEKYVKCLALGPKNSNELATYYDQEILIFDIDEEKIIDRIKVDMTFDLEFNIEKKLLILLKSGNICFYENKKLEKIKGEKITVAKWYPFNGNNLAYATTSGSVCYHDITKKNKISEMELKLSSNITALAWYTLDENYKYVLVGTNDGSILLLDLDQQIIINSFEKHTNDIINLIWLRFEPGSFISISSNSGRVSIWNVSKKSYNEISKFADSPILNCQALSDGAKALLSLDNGSIMIYDVINRKSTFSLEPSHSETIFDIKFNPIRKGVVASCSFDSTIKIWDLNQDKIHWNINVEQILTILDNKVSSTNTTDEKLHIYCIKWSLIDENYILSGDSKGSLRIFDIHKQKYITGLRLLANTKDSNVVGIDWNINNDILATCQEFIYRLKFENGKLILVKSFKSPSVLYQIKFNKFDNSSYAVASHDNVIRVYTDLNDKESKILKGHSRKVFGITFHPIRRGVFSSTGDDKLIGIWDIEKNTSFFLNGHTNNTRHTVWLVEYSNILISSSWDGTIKVWDVDIQACIAEINEHYSDVYGIDINPHHPFMLCTCSRDNSIKFFNLNISYMKLLEATMNFNKISELEKKFKTELDPISRADMISSYFYCHDGLKDFWDILKVVTRKKEYCSQDNKIFYVTDIFSAYKSRVQHLEFSYFSKTKFDYSIKKEDIIKEAIDLSAKAGDWEKFCELCTEANQWEKAIMAAPNVSLSYWKELSKKYAEYTTNKNLQEKTFASLLCNELQPAIKNSIESGDYEDVKIIWLTRGNKADKYKDEDYKSVNNFPKIPEFTETYNRLSNLPNDDPLTITTHLIAKRHLMKGFPILAASSFLSVNDIFNTIKSLVRTKEYEIAYLTMNILNDKTFENEIITGIALESYKKGGIIGCKYVLERIENIELKITLAKFFWNYTKNIIFSEFDGSIDLVKNNDNEFLYYICSNNISKSINLFYTESNQMADDLNSKKIQNSKWWHNLNKFMFYLKAVDFKQIKDNEKFYIRMLLVSAVLETFNNNIKSCRFYILETNRILTKNKNSIVLDNYEVLLISFAISFINGRKNEEICINLEFIKLINLTNSVNDTIQSVRKNSEKSSLKFFCDDIEYFYCLRDEIIPVNINIVNISNLNGKKIRGNPVKVSNNFLLSISQSLEWFKYIPICPILEDLQLFNPY